MKKKSLSTLGYIMDNLKIQTGSMAAALHVDASLVSKWRTGSRTLSQKSIYFDDVIDYILEQSTKTIHEVLEATLSTLYPQEKPEDETELEKLLRKALSNQDILNKKNEYNLISNGSNTININIFDGNEGRRIAMSQMLDYAASMPNPGEFIFIDNENFQWLLEDTSYAKDFIRRFEDLLHKDFHATFVVNYTLRKNLLVNFFDICCSLIFHRNIDWYCHEYYDNIVVNHSIFVLNHAISLLGISSDSVISSTMIFTDNSTVLKHEAMARNFIKHSNPLFTYFHPNKMRNLLSDVSHLRQRGNFYACLPYPAFITVGEELLTNILDSNHIDGKYRKRCLKINHRLKSIIFRYFNHSNYNIDNFTYIFNLNALISRTELKKFQSKSLSLVCEDDVFIYPAQFIQELRNLSRIITSYPNIRIVLVADEDHISLPPINCWCKQNIWMIQMNYAGIRLSTEYNINNAALNKWEQCIRQVPSERKNSSAVSQFLNELADNLERKIQ